MINKLCNNRLIKQLFIIMLVLQPLFNLDILYSDKIISIFKFSPSTIIRLLLVLILAMMVFLSKKKGKQEKKILLYSIFYVIFIFLHHYNSVAFTANITGDFKYSVISELFYLFRMFVPILIIYISANVKITHNDLRKILKIIVLSFSLVIIISNLFTFGIKSYGYGKISYNIFSWFTSKDAGYSDYLTIGLFIGTNRLGSLLVSLLPLSIYYYLADEKNYFIGIVFLHIITLIMIGTRTATFAFIPIVFLMIFLDLYIAIFRKKQKLNLKKYIILIFVTSVLIILSLNSPINTRNEYNDIEKAHQTNDNVRKESFDESEGIAKKYSNEVENNILCVDCEAKEDIVEFIEKYYKKLYISYDYIDIYNYNYDYLFWFNIINLPFKDRSNGRKIQYLISQRLFELNNNKLKDNLFGIGYSRFKNADLYLEKDFLVQYYTCGIIGVILFVAPYCISLICAAIYIIKNFKKKLDFDLLTYCFCLSLFLICGYLGGHVLDEMLTYIFMSLISGLILNKISHNDSNVDTINCVNNKDLISVIIPAYNVEEYLDECINSIKNQKNLKCDIEIIIINDASTDNTLNICKKYQSDKSIIIIDNIKNRGQAYSRNVGIRRAKGKYVVFVDSDDLLYDNALSKLYNEIKKTNADIVMAKLNSFNSRGTYGYYSDKYMNVYKVGSIYDNMELINCISVCSKIYKKEFIKNMQFLDKTIHEDNSFTLIAYFKAKKIVVLSEYLYYRRIRENENNKSIMQNLNYKTFIDLIKNYQYVLNHIDGKIPKKLKFYMIRQLNNTIVKHVNPKQYNNAYNELNNFINRNLHRKIYKIYHKIYKILTKIYCEIKSLVFKK